LNKFENVCEQRTVYPWLLVMPTAETGRSERQIEWKAVNPKVKAK